jgi:hypothetical protein
MVLVAMIGSDFAVLLVRRNAEVESAGRFAQAPNFQALVYAQITRRFSAFEEVAGK